MNTIFRILFRITAVLTAVILLLVLALNIPLVQNWVIDRTTNYLSNKTQTTISIDSFKLRFPRSLIIEGIYVEDRQADTLLYAGRLHAVFSLTSLLSRRINILEVGLSNVKADLHPVDSTTMNYQALVDAFRSPPEPSSSDPAEKKSNSGAWSVLFPNTSVYLNDIDLFFLLPDSTFGLDLNLGRLDVKSHIVDLQQGLIDLEDITLGSTDLKMIMRGDAPEVPDDTTDTTAGMIIKTGRMMLEDVAYHLDLPEFKLATRVPYAEATEADLQFSRDTLLFETPKFVLRQGTFSYDLPVDPVSRGFDFNHIGLDSINLTISDIRYFNLDITGNIEQVTAIDKSGFGITNLQTDLHYTLDSVRLTNFEASTQHSSISLPYGFFTFPFIQGQAPVQEMQTDIDLKEAKIHTGDIACFVPLLGENELFSSPPQLITLKARAKGTLKDLKIPRLELQGWNSRLAMKGTLKNLLDMSLLGADLDLNSLTLSQDFLLDLIPGETLPDYVELPDMIEGTGKFSGDVRRMDFGLYLQSQRPASPVAMVLKINGRGADLLDNERLSYDINIDTLFSTREVLQAYLPTGQTPARLDLPDDLLLTGILRGTLDSVYSDLNLSLRRREQTSRISAGGTVFNLRQPEKLAFELKLDSLAVVPEELTAYLPDSLLPTYLHVPAINQGMGYVEGALSDLKAGIFLQTDAGKINLEGFLADSSYTANLGLEHFYLPAFFDPAAYDTLIGRDLSAFTLDLEVKGAGFDPASDLVADVDLFVRPEAPRLGWKEGLRIQGTVDRYSFDGQCRVNEPGLTLSLNALTDFNRDSSFLADIFFELDTLDFKKLLLSDQTFTLAGEIALNAQGQSRRNYEGTLAIRSVDLQFDTLIKQMDSLVLEAWFTPENNRLTLESDIARGFVEGNFAYPGVLANIRQFALSYFRPAYAEAVARDSLNETLNFSLEFIRPDILTTGFFPDLQELSPATISGAYHAGDEQLFINALFPRVKYRDIGFDTLGLDIIIREDTFSYQAGFEKMEAYDQFQAFNFSVSGKALNGTIINELKQFDAMEQSRFNIKFVAERLEKSLAVSFQPDVLLNYNTWQFSPGNRITLHPKSFQVENWQLSREGQILKLEDQNNKDLALIFRQFDLKLFSDIVGYNEQYLKGILDGTIVLRNLFSEARIEVDSKIADLHILEAQLGDMSMRLQQGENKDFNGNMAFKGNGHDFSLQAAYQQQENSQVIGLQLDAKTIELARLQPLINDYVTDLTGQLTGTMDIRGPLNDLEMNGSMAFRSTTLRISELQALWTLGTSPITFSTVSEGGRKRARIGLDQFTITDQGNNPIALDGYIQTPDLSSFSFLMRVNANNFLVMDTKEKDNELYYGHLRVDADGILFGDLDSANVSLNVTPKKNSTFVYNYPVDQVKSLESGEGIIEFRSLDSLYIEPEKRSRTVSRSDLNPLGWDFNINASVNDDLEITVNTNPFTGDNFKGKGEGDLAFRLTPKGMMDLSGRLKVVEGSYLFTYSQLIKREFDVVEGSFLDWSGDILNPDLEVQARYRTKAAPFPLVINPDNLPEQQKERYKRRQEFDAVFQVTGDLEDMEIKSSIDYPNTSFNSKSADIEQLISQVNQDETETNTQAFSLLLFNGFLNTGASSGSGSSYSVINVQQSFSDLITSYLNNFANNYIDFVELDFDIESSGSDLDNYFENTDFRVTIKKTFLDDRLEVSVDGVASSRDNFDQGAAPSGSSSQMQAFLDNITVTYDLTKDGLLKIKVYNQRDIDDFLGGQIVKLGGALVFSKDFGAIRFSPKKMQDAVPVSPPTEFNDGQNDQK